MQDGIQLCMDKDCNASLGYNLSKTKPQATARPPNPGRSLIFINELMLIDLINGVTYVQACALNENGTHYEQRVHNVLCRSTVPAQQQYGTLPLISKVNYVIFLQIPLTFTITHIGYCLSRNKIGLIL